MRDERRRVEVRRRPGMTLERGAALAALVLVTLFGGLLVSVAVLFTFSDRIVLPWIRQ